MVRDLYMRIAGVPTLGLVIPYISGIITYSLYTGNEIFYASIFFTLISLAIWSGSAWIHSKLRPLFSRMANALSRILAVVSANAVYGSAIGALAALAWYKVSRETLRWNNFCEFVAICALAVIVFTLLYETLYLSKEREEDSKLVQQMDNELTQAELKALTNEMDPHFIFNSLNAMNYLILNNPVQAQLFNNHLAKVYKYFLLNKNRKLIPLAEELAFIESYFFLLEIRYDQNIRLNISLHEHEQNVMIPACAVQVLIENAIKHNMFSEKEPLHIAMRMNDRYLEVINNVRPKSYPHNSTHTGLKNLALRFRLICQEEIILRNNSNQFIVQLPIIHQKNVSHDQSNYY